MKNYFYKTISFILIAVIIVSSVTALSAVAAEQSNASDSIDSSSDLTDTPTDLPVEKVYYGDCNADSKISMADVLYLRKYIARYKIEINLKNADTNNDSKINMKDVLILRYHLANRPVIFGQPNVNLNLSDTTTDENIVCQPKIASITANSTSEITLEFSSSDNYDYFELARREYGGVYNYVLRLDSANPFTNKPLSHSTRYYYKIRAVKTVDDIKYYSPYCDEKYATTHIPTPANVKASVNLTDIKISWNKLSNIEEYKIYRLNSGNKYTEVATVNATSYTDKSLAVNTKYSYKVSAVKKIENSTYESNLSNSVSATTKNNYIKTTYGKSYNNRDLNAYIFNKNATKTMLLTFCVHGFEDEYDKDGKVLVDCGNAVIDYYNKNISKLNGIRLVVVPCVNPDGVTEGKNNLRTGDTAFGRCTANHVDINRDFIKGGFKAKESKALLELIKEYNPTWLLDFHGWENSVLGDSTVVKTFMKTLGLKTDKSGIYRPERGYIIGYAKETLKVKHCALIEFASAKSVNHSKVITALNLLLLS